MVNANANANTNTTATTKETERIVGEQISPVNHKGELCFINARFCQEGYCSNCQVAKDYIMGINCSNKTLMKMKEKLLSLRQH
jgi:hypothetical protein